MPDKNTIESVLNQEIKDLTLKLHEADEFCRNSREKFQKALLASPDPVCIIDLETFRIVDLNNNFVEGFGYSREESLGKTSVELGIWTNLDERKRLKNLIVAEGCLRNYETQFKNKDGEAGTVLISAEKIISEGRECLLAYFRTVTGIRKTEDQYKLLAENSTDVIWILNLDGSFSYVSPSVKKLRGFTPEEVLKQSFQEVMTEESAQKVSILLKSLLDNDQSGISDSNSFQTEIEQLCEDGSTVWTEVLITPIRDKHGKLQEILGVSRNIQGKKTALEKAEDRSKALEGIFRSSPLGMGMVVERKFSLVNDKFCEMIGYSRKELLGKDSRLIYKSDNEYERIGREVYDKIRETGSGGLNTCLTKKDGSIVDVYINSTPVDRNDWAKGIIFNILDVSAIKEVENRLAANKEKYTSFFNHINDAILIHPWKESGFANFIEVNEIACKKYGYSREELLQMNAEDITIASDIEVHSKNEFRSQIEDKGSMVFESVHLHKDGSRFPVEISSNIIDINGDRIILAVVRDISERKKAEATNLESELKYREMFENSPEAMLILDNRGYITDSNTAFFEISGRSPGNLIGKHFSKTDLISVKQIPEYIKLFYRVLKQKRNQSIELDWISAEGAPRRAMAHVGPIVTGGKVTGLQALLKDTTQQKEFEKNLILAKEKAEENDRLKTAFLETMSHELRTPLNAVIGFSNLIEDESDLSSIAEMNQYVTENGKKLLSIIESIFDISVLETHNAKIKSENFDLNDLFTDLEITLTGLIELEKKGDINILYQPDRKHRELKINSDKKRIKQLLSNLLTNSVRYTDKGSIRYGYNLIKGDIEFFVSDTGIGIPADKTKMIFEKFRQIDYSSTRTRGGVGLGLSICQEIAKLLNGSLRVESNPGVGSTFYFKLPMHPNSTNNNQPYGFDLTGKCFLVVEDVESNFLYLEKLLTESGAKVIWAQTGEEAISVANNIDAIDLVLMDIRMPDMNGYDITREIKKSRPALPIIAQTAYAMVSDQKEAIDAGCSAHISKPIRVEDLRNTICDFLSIEQPRRLII